MPVIIKDEFSHLKGTISRSRLCQLRRAAKGLCLRCDKKAMKWGLCRGHVLDHTAYKRAKYQQLKDEKATLQPTVI